MRNYHQRTKHRPDRYASSPGYMDWANQPNPFRSFAGAAPMDLPHPVLRDSPTYDGLFSQSPVAAKLDVELIARLFYHSLALSAWTQAPRTDPWSLRINPSSGDLHPTEGYLISGPVPGLTDEPGVFHYAPFHHRLERRCLLSGQAWQALSRGIPAPCLLIALTSTGGNPGSTGNVRFAIAITTWDMPLARSASRRAPSAGRRDSRGGSPMKN